MSDLPKNAGTIGIITGTAGAGAAGIAAVAFGLLEAGPAFLIFGTMFLQSFTSSLKLQGEIDAEVARQQGICDQLAFTQKNLDTLNNTLTLLQGKGQIDQDTIVQQIGTMSDNLNAEITKLSSLKSNFKTNLLIQIVIYIIIVTVLIFIILSKKNSST